MKKRNPIARDLFTPKFKMKVEKDPDVYDRKKQKKLVKEAIDKDVYERPCQRPLLLLGFWRFNADTALSF